MALASCRIRAARYAVRGCSCAAGLRSSSWLESILAIVAGRSHGRGHICSRNQVDCPSSQWSRSRIMNSRLDPRVCSRLISEIRTWLRMTERLRTLCIVVLRALTLTVPAPCSCRTSALACKGLSRRYPQHSRALTCSLPRLNRFVRPRTIDPLSGFDG